MAKTITQLPDATSVNSSDEMIVQQSGITKRATVAEVMAGGAASLPAGTVISGSSASAALRVTQTGAGNALIIEDDPSNPDATPLVINADGQIISGATTAFSSGGALQIVTEGVISTGNSIELRRCSSDDTPFLIRMSKSRGTNASPTIVSDGDIAFNLTAQAYDGANYGNISVIRTTIDGAPSATVLPSRITFSTRPSTAGVGVAERMRIDSAGNVGIGTTANAAAILDVASTTKGFLPPRMTGAQRDAISTPPAGLMVYVTDAGPGGTTGKLNFYNGTAWEAVTSS